MSRKYSLAHLTALPCPLPELIYIAAGAGYDYVSPRLVNMGLPGESNYDLVSQPALLKQVKKALTYTGIGVHDIELMRILPGKDPEDYRSAMEIGASLGAKYVLSSVWTDDKPYYTECFAKLCDIAEDFHMGVMLEFVTWAGITGIEGAKALLEEVKKPNAGLMIDMLHAHRSRVRPEELDGCPKEWFRFFHMCDGPAAIPDTAEELIVIGRDARRYPGEGAIDIAGYVRRMPKEAVCSIELPHLARASEFGYAEHARRCITASKNYLERRGL